MRKSSISSRIQLAIPAELYDIVPGQIAYFAPKCGLDPRTASQISDLFAFFREHYKNNSVKLSIVPTDNEILIDTFAGRNPNDDDYTFYVFVSVWKTVEVFASCIFDVEEDMDVILERADKKRLESVQSLMNNSPTFVFVNPENHPENKMCLTCPYMDNNGGNYYTEVLQAKPEPGSKEEKKLIEKEEDKLYSLLRECYVLDVDLDIDKVRKKFDEAIHDTTDYNLIIKTERNKPHHGKGEFSVFDIYVADGEQYKLDLTAVEKAIYLTFLLYGDDGIRIAGTFWEFRRTSQMIYRQMPFDERCDTTAGDMVDDDYEVYLKTLRGYLSTIRTKVAKKVLQPKTAIEFAIEGYKDEAFCIKRSTREIRKQLKKDLHL